MIRIAIIGMGQRGQATLSRLRDIGTVQIVATCDREKDWHEVVSRPDIDLVYICTPWELHVEMAVETMKQGKHVAIEVPAAMTVSECELLVRISRWTDRHCVMLENCCYDTWHLGIREMVQQGLLGEVTHLEGAYIHTVNSDWMLQQRQQHQGNPYPTHGLGPMCQLLAPNDRLETLVSMSAYNKATGDHINDTLLRTRFGVTMLLQYDTSTPRPYNRLQTVCGTKGFAQKYPLPTLQLQDTPDGPICLTGEEATRYVESHIPALFRQLIDEGNERHVPNIMNYMMDRRLIDVLEQEVAGSHEEGEKRKVHLDMEVHEAALWSSITELTERSASQGGATVLIPDF